MNVMSKTVTIQTPNGEMNIDGMTTIREIENARAEWQEVASQAWEANNTEGRKRALEQMDKITEVVEDIKGDGKFF